MNREQRIGQSLKQHFEPVFLEVVNESKRHRLDPGGETHFRLLVVSSKFDGKSAVARHREIYTVLADELNGGLHALTLDLRTPGEWESDPRAKQSPRCASQP